MSLASEEDVKKALGISTWRELSKAKMMALAVELPNMTDELRVRLLEKLPEFQQFLLDSVGVVERSQTEAIGANSESQNRAHDAFQDVRDMIKHDLARDDLTEEQRRYLYEAAMKTAEQQAIKDTENKRFLLDGLKTVAMATGMGALAALAFVGAKVIGGRNGSA